MITVKELHTQQTVKAAVRYITISELHSKEQLQKLDRIMDWLAMNPKLLK